MSAFTDCHVMTKCKSERKNSCRCSSISRVIPLFVRCAFAPCTGLLSSFLFVVSQVCIRSLLSGMDSFAPCVISVVELS